MLELCEVVGKILIEWSSSRSSSRCRNRNNIFYCSNLGVGGGGSKNAQKCLT